MTIAMLLTTLVYAADHVWKTARVVDASTDKRFRPGVGTFSSRWVTLESDEFSYVIRESLPPFAVGSVGMIIASPIVRRHHGCRFIVNDSIRFSETRNKNWLYVIDADGKECKAEIFRQERLKKTAQPAESK